MSSSPFKSIRELAPEEKHVFLVIVIFVLVGRLDPFQSLCQPASRQNGEKWHIFLRRSSSSRSPSHLSYAVICMVRELATLLKLTLPRIFSHPYLEERYRRWRRTVRECWLWKLTHSRAEMTATSSQNSSGFFLFVFFSIPCFLLGKGNVILHLGKYPIMRQGLGWYEKRMWCILLTYEVPK